MLTAAYKRFYEFGRCTRHNLLHLKTFRLSYRRGLWRVRDGELEMLFPYYPYLAFHDIEGYIREGSWRPEKGMTVLDVGGCFGEFALYAAKRVGPEGRVLMLEPEPANLEVARRLFSLNGNPSNIEIIQAGLWSSPGKVRFRAGLGDRSTVLCDEPVTDENMIEIDVLSLPSLIEKHQVERLDLVKMDIEGAELQAIAGARELPKHLRPRYSIASYHMVEGRRTAESLVEIFSALGYHARTGNPRHLTTWASPTPFAQ